MILKDQILKKQTEEILSSMISSYGKKEVEGFVKPYLENERVLSIGTGDEEWILGLTNIKSFLERDFAQSGEIKISHKLRHLELFGDTVCCAALVNADVELEGGIFSIKGRFSMTLKEIAGELKIIQSHFSAPLSDQHEGNSFGSPKKN